MLIKGIKKGKTIELLEEIDFPDNQEVLIEIQEPKNFWSALQDFRARADLESLDDNTFENVLEYLETLSEEEQEEVFDLVKNRRIKKRRSEIAENGRKTLEAIEKGTSKRGSCEEIKSYLLAD